MLEHGFHAVGLNKLLSSVNIPKGSFYHWFSSKEQFGVELLRYHTDAANAQRKSAVLERSNGGNPLERLFALFEEAVTCFEDSGCKCVCLIQKLAPEVSNFSEPMREELAKGFSDAITVFQKALEAAVSEGLLPSDFDSENEAEFIMDHWAGAQQRAALNRSSEPLKKAILVFRKHLAT